MPELVEQTYEDVRSLARDYFGVSDSESETLMQLAKKCARTTGIPMAGAGAVALAGAGTVAVPLIGAVPGYVAGALAGFVGGVTTCMIASRSAIVPHVRQILSSNGVSEHEFKSEVRKLIATADGRSGYYVSHI